MAPAAPLTARQLGRATLARQGLLQPITGPAAAAVARIGSLQAQHPEWPPVALAAHVGRVKGGIRVWGDAVAALSDEVVTLRGDDGRTLVDVVDAPRPDPETAPPRLLARWDSLLLSHGSKHRQRIIADEHRPTVFSRNADVLPTFLLDGIVAGTWELSRSDERAAITLRPFSRVPRADADPLVAEAERVLGLLAPDARRSVELAPRGS